MGNRIERMIPTRSQIKARLVVLNPEWGYNADDMVEDFRKWINDIYEVLVCGGVSLKLEGDILVATKGGFYGRMDLSKYPECIENYIIDIIYPRLEK